MNRIPFPDMKRPLIAILRGIRPEEAVAHVQALVEEGYDAIEIPLNSPDWPSSIGAVVREFGTLAWIGTLPDNLLELVNHHEQARSSRSLPGQHPGGPGQVLGHAHDVLAVLVGLALLAFGAAASPPDASAATGSALDGNGMWIWYVSRSSGGDLSRIADKAVS